MEMVCGVHVASYGRIMRPWRSFSVARRSRLVSEEHDVSLNRITRVIIRQVILLSTLHASLLLVTLSIYSIVRLSLKPNTQMSERDS